MNFNKFCQKLGINPPSFSDYVYNLPITFNKLSQRKVKIELNTPSLYNSIGLYVFKKWESLNFYKYQALLVSYEFYRNKLYENSYPDYLEFVKNNQFRSYIVLSTNPNKLSKLIIKILKRFYREQEHVISSVSSELYTEIKNANDCITVINTKDLKAIKKQNIVHLSTDEVNLNNINEILNSPNLYFSGYCKRYLFSNSFLSISKEVPYLILNKVFQDKTKLIDNEALNFGGKKRKIAKSKL